MEIASTEATGRYQKKMGLISKSLKLDRETVEMFAEACENAETPQSKELTKFMKRFIKKHHPDFERYGVHPIIRSLVICLVSLAA